MGSNKNKSFYYSKLSNKDKFIRSLYLLPFIIIFALIPANKYILFQKSHYLIVLSIVLLSQIIYTFIKYKKDK